MNLEHTYFICSSQVSEVRLSGQSQSSHCSILLFNHFVLVHKSSEVRNLCLLCVVR